MALSDSTIRNLATALTKDVIDYIQQDERYIELIMELVPESISEALGSQDIDLVTEIAMCVTDNIIMKPFKTL
tara:strand:+ start:1080 stop:1298 length:219 start_codon:yes stop_codon:yes gene_type:complete